MTTLWGIWHDAGATEPVRVARDGVSVAGRSVSCGNVRTELDVDLPNLGIAVPQARLLVLNPSRMRRFNDTVQLFVFHHECGHHHVGGSELKADCWAVNAGVKAGWLDRPGLDQACRSFGDAPPTPTHPSGARRCANLDRCFAAASATQGKSQQARQQSTTATLVTASVTRDAPRLVSGPTLVRNGTGR